MYLFLASLGLYGCTRAFSSCGEYLLEKKESPKGEKAVKPVISLPSEKWVLKIGFLKVQNW